MRWFSLLLGIIAFAVLPGCSTEQLEGTKPATTNAPFPPLDYLFAAHQHELRMATTAAGTSISAAYYAADSQPDYLRSGLLLSSEVHKTHMLAVSFETCERSQKAALADSVKITWDYFRRPPKHFMGRINWTCGQVRNLYGVAAKNSKTTLPILVGRNGAFYRIEAPLPPLRSKADTEDWRDQLRKTRLEAHGALQPGTPFKHNAIDYEKIRQAKEAAQQR